VPFEDVERLMGDLAVFGDDKAMQRSRKIARALLKAMEAVPPATVQLTDEERIDVHVALTRVGQRGGLSQQLTDLRIACAPR
jgi:Fe-S-cluster formation regulator IscX/YfhJ